MSLTNEQILNNELFHLRVKQRDIKRKLKHDRNMEILKHDKYGIGIDLTDESICGIYYNE